MIDLDHPQVDLLIVDALVRYAHECERVDPDRADLVIDIATRLAAAHGLTLVDAIEQLDYDAVGNRSIRTG